MSEPKPERPIAQRIEELHGWYSKSVLDMPLLPEVERLWLAFFKQRFNGPDLALVIRYLKRQISLGKRNEGALKLSNLFERSEEGSYFKFAEDLALARQWEAGRRPKLAPLPEGEAPVSAPPFESAEVRAPQLSEEERRRRVETLEELKKTVLGRQPWSTIN